MSVFEEKVHSLRRTREFLRELLRPNKLTKKEIRARVSSCLRHWPFEADVKIKDDNGKWQKISDSK